MERPHPPHSKKKCLAHLLAKPLKHRGGTIKGYFLGIPIRHFSYTALFAYRALWKFPIRHIRNSPRRHIGKNTAGIQRGKKKKAPRAVGKSCCTDWYAAERKKPQTGEGASKIETDDLRLGDFIDKRTVRRILFLIPFLFLVLSLFLFNITVRNKDIFVQ